MSFGISIDAIDATEVDLVARAVAHAEREGLVRVARVATRLGNGWLYPIVSLFLVTVARIEAPLRFLAAASASLALAFAIYPALKTFIARARPCDHDPSLARLPEPLDHYSCPSGHAMTAAASAVPAIFACPAAAPLVLALCVVIGWSRVALGHHYVSDVVAGTILGAAVAVPVSAFLY
jgi:undecaprenyl-diphosphatase